MILLVDDDETFRKELVLALTSVGLSVLTAANGEEGVRLLVENPAIDVILSDLRTENKDGANFLAEVRKISQIPFILQTGFSELLETVDSSKHGVTGFLSKPYSVEDLAEYLSEIFISRRPLKLETNDADFAKISVDDFVSGRLLDCGIYLRLAENRYVKIANRGEDLDIERVQGYKLRGIRYLFLKKEDFRNYLSKSLLITKKVSKTKTIDPEKRLRFLRHTGAVMVEKVLIDDIDSQALSGATDFFSATVDIISEQEDLFKMLTLLNEHSDHVYAHSIGVSVYSVMIAQALGWTSNPTVFRIGLAGLLHDIGKKEIDRQVLDTPRALHSRDERTKYESHPSRGSEILASCESIPEEVSQAVRQHHEDSLGFGYPHGIKGKNIAPLAQLVQVANYFCGFTIKNPNFPKGMAARDAVERMRKENVETLEPKFFAALQDLVKPL